MTKERGQKGIFVTGVIRGTKIKFLVDTGSTQTVLSTVAYIRLPKGKRPKLNSMESCIKQADGTPIEAWGHAIMDLQIGEKSQSLMITVASIKGDGILGMDFLLATGGNLDFDRLKLQIDGEQIPCRDDEDLLFCARVVISQTTTIPANQEVVVPVKITRPTNIHGLAIIEPTGRESISEKGLVIARTLVETGQVIMPTRIINLSCEEQVIKEGTVTGIISPIRNDADIIFPIEIRELHHDVNRDSYNTAIPEHLKDLYTRSTGNLGEGFHTQVEEMLIEFQDVFSKGDHDIGRTDLVKHKINTENVAPIRQPPRRAPMGQQEEINQQVTDMLQRRVIEPSNSPWAAPVVLVTKKDGSKRFCVDYRRLNDVTIKDAYPIPRIEESLDALTGSKWFSTLDLASGYWQVELDDDAKDKSAFTVRGGLYAWNVMPFGLSNAPSTFERLMERVMAGLQWDILLVYLDDIIVYGKTDDEATTRLKKVLQRLRMAGLKLKPKKCHLYQREVLYLGYVVSEKGIHTDPEKVKAVKEWPRPIDVTQVRSFLGLASYYRRFIRGFADVARPLHKLTEKHHKFEWSDDCEEAFVELKSRLIKSPILAYPDPKLDFILDTDASNLATGAVLSQIQGEQEQVVAYASKTLSSQERNYCVTRRELLAVVLYLRYFRHYLYGRKVLVRTDHGSLRWLTNFRNPEGQLARWMEVIGQYDITIEHRPGRLHGNADGLSRRPCKQCGRQETTPINDTLKTEAASSADVMSDEQNQSEYKTVEEMNSEQVEDDNWMRSIFWQPEISCCDVRQGQLEDQTINTVLMAKEGTKERPRWEEISAYSPAVKTYWAQWDQLEVHSGVLCKKWESADGEQTQLKVILPGKYRNEILEQLHGSKTAGHMGLRKTLEKVRTRYYWVGMSAYVRSFVRKCNLCARRKSPPKKRRAPLQQYRVGAPLERVAMDILGPLPETEKGNIYILVIGDYFTKWMEAHPLPDQKAETVAKKFVEEFVCRFGVPRELHTDQGRNFEADIVKEMCKYLGIQKTRTTGYNPKSDGMVERFNRTLMNIVSNMIDPVKRQKDWDDQLPYATLAYRTSVQESTGETPSMMMLGRELTLPLDVIAESPFTEEEIEESDYAEQLRMRMQLAHDVARNNLKSAAVRQKRNYDRRTCYGGIKEGTFVWLHNPRRKRGLTTKLCHPWDGPFLVIKRLSDVIFRIQERPHGKLQVVHVDRLKLYEGQVKSSWLPHKETSNDGSVKEEEKAVLRRNPSRERKKPLRYT